MSPQFSQVEPRSTRLNRDAILCLIVEAHSERLSSQTGRAEPCSAQPVREAIFCLIEQPHGKGPTSQLAQTEPRSVQSSREASSANLRGSERRIGRERGPVQDRQSTG